MRKTDDSAWAANQEEERHRHLQYSGLNRLWSANWAAVKLSRDFLPDGQPGHCGFAWGRSLRAKSREEWGPPLGADEAPLCPSSRAW